MIQDQWADDEKRRAASERTAEVLRINLVELLEKGIIR